MLNITLNPYSGKREILVPADELDSTVAQIENATGFEIESIEQVRVGARTDFRLITLE